MMKCNTNITSSAIYIFFNNVVICNNYILSFIVTLYFYNKTRSLRLYFSRSLLRSPFKIKKLFKQIPKWTTLRSLRPVSVSGQLRSARTDHYDLGQADIILANSKFTSRVFRAHFSSIHSTPQVVYPGINLSAYEPTPTDAEDPDITQVTS